MAAASEVDDEYDTEMELLKATSKTDDEQGRNKVAAQEENSVMGAGDGCKLDRGDGFAQKKGDSEDGAVLCFGEGPMEMVL